MMMNASFKSAAAAAISLGAIAFVSATDLKADTPANPQPPQNATENTQAPSPNTGVNIEGASLFETLSPQEQNTIENARLLYSCLNEIGIQHSQTIVSAMISLWGPPPNIETLTSTGIAYTLEGCAEAMEIDLDKTDQAIANLNLEFGQQAIFAITSMSPANPADYSSAITHILEKLTIAGEKAQDTIIPDEPGIAI